MKRAIKKKECEANFTLNSVRYSQKEKFKLCPEPSECVHLTLVGLGGAEGLDEGVCGLRVQRQRIVKGL